MSAAPTAAAFWSTASSEAREDREVEEGELLGLSSGEMLADEVGVESVVANRRRAVSEGRAVVVMVGRGGRAQAQEQVPVLGVLKESGRW